MARAIATALQQDGNAEALKAQLKGVEAQIASLNAQIANTGNTAPPNFKKAADSTTQLGKAAGDADKQVSEATQNAERGFTEWSDAADAASLATQKVTADTLPRQRRHAAPDTQAIGEARAGYLAISPAAAAFYDTTLKNAFAFATESDSAGAGFEKTARYQVAADETNKAISNQRTQLAGEVEQINLLGTAGAPVARQLW